RRRAARRVPRRDPDDRHRARAAVAARRRNDTAEPRRPDAGPKASRSARGRMSSCWFRRWPLARWPSRTVTGTAARGVFVLLGTAIGAIVLGLKSSPAPWLAPPVMQAARDSVGGAGLDQVLVATLWGLAWAFVAFAGYVWLRRTRRRRSCI